MPSPDDFRLAFEQGADLSLMLTPGAPFTVLAVTDAYLRATGMRREDLAGKPLFDVFSDAPDAPQGHVLRALRASLERALATRTPDAMPVQWFDLPGAPSRGVGLEARHWRPLNVPVVAPGGDVRCLVHRVEDVTSEVRLAAEGRAAEARARDERERLRDVFRRVPVAIAILRGPTHVVELANEQICRLWGRAPEQVLGQPLFEALPEAVGQGFEQLLDGVLASGTPRAGREVPARIARPDLGTVEGVYLDFTYEPLRDPSGRVESVLVVATDVTGGVRARRDVEARAAARLARFFELSPDFLATASFVTGRWASVNPAMSRAFGFTEAELLAKPFMDLVHPDDLARSQEAAARTAAGVLLVDFEHRVLCKDGGHRWVEWHTIGSPDEGLLYCAGRDVTERRRHEAEREASFARERAARAEADLERRKLHELFLQAPMPIATLEGPDYVFTFANPPYRELVGGRDVVGRPCFEVLPDVEGQGFRELFDRVMARGETVVGREVAVRLAHHAPGEAVFLDVTYTPMRDASGAVTGILASHADVTAPVLARRRVESLAAELRASEERLRQALEASGAGSWDLDAATGAIAADARMLALMGLPPDADFTLASGLQNLPPEDRDRVERAILAALAGENGGRYFMEFRTLRPGGADVRWVESRAHALFDAEGKATRLAGTMADVTQRKEAELAQAKLLESIADQSVFGVAVLAGPELRFELANPGYRALVGGRDVAGLPLLEALPELAGQGADTLLLEIMRTGKAMTFREQLYHIDARGTGRPEPRYYNFIWQPLARFGGRADAVLVITHDVTESVVAREQEKASRARAEEANRLKDEFLATISHELRTPLNAILGWTQLLRTEDPPDDRLRGALETIERNARAQAQLIDDLLDVGRILSGKMRLEVESVDLRLVVEGALESMRPAAEARGVRLEAAFDSAGAVMGDAQRLGQVVWNLLSNAVKFTPRGGRVRVTVERREEAVEVTVADTGRGIAPDFLPHVFERFRQADASSARRQGGLGIGLSLVKQLTELHGGVVTVASEGEGKGASFTVRLPLAVARGRQSPSAQASAAASARAGGIPCPPELAGLRALVVDDEPDARAFVGALLEGCGVAVTTAASAAEALEALKRQRPDILVSDIGMPGEDGYALIGRVRALALAEGGETPAVAVTAYARAEDRTRILLTGFQSHVPKPVEPMELLAVLATLARGARAQRP